MKEYITHWVIGIVCTAVYLFGAKFALPAEAIQLAGATIPGLMGHALAFTPEPEVK